MAVPITGDPPPQALASPVVPAAVRPRRALARSALGLHRVFDGASRSARDLLSGLALGVLGDESLDAAVAAAYEGRSEFRDAAFNASGLRPWESEFVIAHLRPASRVLVASAGGGREVLALHRMGFGTEAFECNEALAEWGNAFLRERAPGVTIRRAAPSEVPAGLGACDAVVVGWGAYPHIRPSSRRIAFLRGLRALVSPGDPVLLSFFERSGPHSDRAARIGAAVRAALARTAVEPGDIFGPPPMHLFERREIESELAAGGFRPVFYSGHGYPHAAGVAE